MEGQTDVAFRYHVFRLPQNFKFAKFEKTSKGNFVFCCCFLDFIYNIFCIIMSCS